MLQTTEPPGQGYIGGIRARQESAGFLALLNHLLFDRGILLFIKSYFILLYQDPKNILIILFFFKIISLWQ